MSDALAWIGQVAEWIGQWIPRWIILDPTQAGVKYVHGSRVVPMQAGIHFYWPAVTKVQVYPCARQADELRAQTIVTTDDRTIIVAGLVVYEVTEILKLLPTTWQPQGAVKDLSLTAVHDVCCRMSWDQLKEEQRKGTLDTKLRNETKRALADYGVSVLKVQLTDLAPARVIKLLQTTTTEASA